MRRREFILAASSLLAGPFAANAQQLLRAPRLGVLLLSTPQRDLNMPSLVAGLQDHGLTAGRNFILEYGYAEGRLDRLPSVAADLVRTKPDVLFSMGGEV